jgi:hypothetical protein
MNKQFFALFAAAGLACVASLASAAPTITGASTTITTANCPLLAEQVTVGMSARVVGSYNCSAAANTVRVGSCHPGGSRAPLACNSVQNQAAIDAGAAQTPAVVVAPEYPAGCTAAGTGTSTVAEFKAFVASSRGGAMAEVPLGGACDAGRLGGLANLN